ncbi:MAG: putative sulfate exporter family transporter [Paludibacter sp.]|nr:putative sulfate exporter family transporter [Paludibacter sp.]
MASKKLITKQVHRIIYLILAVACLTPFITPPIALFLGLAFALTFGSTFPLFNKNASKYLLQISVVGLGFGMNLSDSVKAGSDGMLFTLFSVVSVMFIGILAGKWLGVAKVPSYLIASGTAICGGSAIAAVGPIAKANESEMSVSLATIFVLNAIALFLFPVLGHWLHLSQHQFGMWAAIAIHDTSSVVGAGATFGEEALKVATTVKLTRALWIIPLSLFTSIYFKSKGDKVVIPWFILFFILAMVMNSYLTIPAKITHEIVTVSRQSLTMTLFFIGAGLSRSTIKMVGVKPLVLGIILWFFIAVISLGFIYFLY